ncbi:hypothetical protein KCM76_10445 [Zooshikella marina]|uniref:DUF3592 domain-containing protein n=1 Tax=Zooshikella ganghwensis TaxID=202772 RepID=A0A4P9VGF7_9GAMM|nr:hypothetical protein [Zooshikella ganghwensis]MBU2706408.1 hypothetical protein [Zooshikella ganghwensis]RDH42228.1 hypothetical protein B9G39_01510 [Zooshikella ganghwensis]
MFQLKFISLVLFIIGFISLQNYYQINSVLTKGEHIYGQISKLYTDQLSQPCYYNCNNQVEHLHTRYWVQYQYHVNGRRYIRDTQLSFSPYQQVIEGDYLDVIFDKYQPAVSYLNNELLVTSLPYQKSLGIFLTAPLILILLFELFQGWLKIHRYHHRPHMTA